MVREKDVNWEENLDESKKRVLKKIKMMEVAINNEEKLDLIGEARFTTDWEYLGFRLFLCDEEEASTIIGQCKYFYRFLSHEKLKRVKADIYDIGRSFCKCDVMTMFDPEHECKCEIPDIDTCSRIFYTSLIKEVEDRATEIKPTLSSRVEKVIIPKQK